MSKTLIMRLHERLKGNHKEVSRSCIADDVIQDGSDLTTLQQQQQQNEKIASKEEKQTLLDTISGRTKRNYQSFGYGSNICETRIPTTGHSQTNVFGDIGQMNFVFLDDNSAVKNSRKTP